MSSQLFKIFSIALVLWFSSNIIHVNAQRTCGHDEHEAERLNDPKYKLFLKNLDKEVKRVQEEQQNRSVPQVYEFPVAIHYNWAGISNNVSQCMIDAAINSIDALNKDYLGMNPDLNNYDALTATCDQYYPESAKSLTSNIKFCIARYQHPKCSGLCDGEYAITAGEQGFDSPNNCFKEYINIFVEANTGQLGVAPLSGVLDLGGNGPQVDATTWGGLDNNGDSFSCMTDGQTFNSFAQYNLGRTLTHEMGHYFGLKHVFTGNCSDTGDGDDGYIDTPAQSQENGGKPIVVDCNPANTSNTAENSCTTLDMWCSYMDYSDDTHLFMFTTQQSAKMYALAEMASALTGDPTVKCLGLEGPPKADITLANESSVFCTGDDAPYQLDFEDNSFACPTSWSWTFSGAGVSPTSSMMENPSVTVTMSGLMTATLVSTNAVGSSSQVTKSVYVSIAESGSCPDCGPTFYDTGGPTGNYSASENSKWTYCADPGQVLQLTTSSVDLPGDLFEDVVYIYDGDMLPTDLNTDIGLIGENNSFGGLWSKGNTGSYSGASNITSAGQCFTFLFESNLATEGAGWAATLECIVKPTCMDGIQNQSEEFVDCGGPNCDPCANRCGEIFTDPGGVNNNYNLEDNGTIWTICADNADEILTMDFSLFQTSGASLLIYEGDITLTAANFNNWSYNMQQSGYFPAGAGFSTVNPIKSTGQCFTFYYSVNGSAPTTAGFEALINCCAPDDVSGCVNKNTAGVEFTAMIDNYCSTNTITDISSLRPEELAEDRSCAALAGAQTFYEITCDGDGGMLMVDVSANTNGGNVDAALYGPVSGTCPNYTNATQVACDSDMDPAELSVIAAPNDIYILAVASETRGTFEVTASGAAFQPALPVDLLSYKARLTDGKVLLQWEVAQEVNHSHYTIEISNNGKDYEPLVKVDSGVNGRYQTTDDSPEAGNNYYKLIQEDIDGTTTDFGTQVVSVDGRPNTVNLYPNPVSSGKIVIVDGLMSQTIYEVIILDMAGKRIMSQSVSNVDGLIEINIDNVTSGVNFISIRNSSENHSLRFIKM